jgi:DNA-binding response OmpR family regulator
MSVTDVLVVDDDIAICRIVHLMLSDEQYEVQAAHSVADALGVIEEKSFAVYVLDYKLPDGSGLDVAERIRSKWGATAIILISGYDPSAVTLRAEKLSISEFLEKPFSREIICAAVKKAIDSPKAASELSPGDPPISPVMSRAHPDSILEASGIMTLSGSPAAAAPFVGVRSYEKVNTDSIAFSASSSSDGSLWGISSCCWIAATLCKRPLTRL